MKLHLNYKQGRNVSPINNTELVLLIRAWLAFAGFDRATHTQWTVIV